jgi:hypothetical protein
MAREVRILNANLEDDEDTKEIVIRGVLDQDTLKYIDFDWYQREQGFSNAHNNEIIGAFFAGNKVADITIGMRGKRVKTEGDTYILLDKCFCIDGGQRLFNAAVAVQERPDLKIKQGVKAFINTNEDFENDLFCKLGTTQVRIAPSILMRNRRKVSAAARLMVEINKNSDFALKDRICWNQKKTVFELLHGYTFATIVAMLHAHKGGSLKSSRPYDLLAGLDRVVDRIGEETYTANMINLFEAVDRCWTIRQLGSARESHPQLSPRFLKVFAKLLSSYPDFWNDKDRDQFYFPTKFLKMMRGMKLSEYLSNAKQVPPDVLFEVLRKRMKLDPTFEDLEDAAE